MKLLNVYHQILNVFSSLYYLLEIFFCKFSSSLHKNILDSMIPKYKQPLFLLKAEQLSQESKCQNERRFRNDHNCIDSVHLNREKVISCGSWGAWGFCLGNPALIKQMFTSSVLPRPISQSLHLTPHIRNNWKCDDLHLLRDYSHYCSHQTPCRGTGPQFMDDKEECKEWGMLSSEGCERMIITAGFKRKTLY